MTTNLSSHHTTFLYTNLVKSTSQQHPQTATTSTSTHRQLQPPSPTTGTATSYTATNYTLAVSEPKIKDQKGMHPVEKEVLNYILLKQDSYKQPPPPPTDSYATTTTTHRQLHYYNLLHRAHPQLLQATPTINDYNLHQHPPTDSYTRASEPKIKTNGATQYNDA
jgi:hypothetical protein